MARSQEHVAERLPMTLRAYRRAMSAAAPLANLWLRRRLRRGKEIEDRLSERHGEPTLDRPEGPLVWLHGASVGEIISVFPLVARLRAQDMRVLITSGTVTSAKVIKQRLPEDVLHQFIPLDAPRFVTRFLHHWRPDLGLFVEQDLWPNLIVAAARRRIPLVLINGRMSTVLQGLALAAAHSQGAAGQVRPVSRAIVARRRAVLAARDGCRPCHRQSQAGRTRTAGQRDQACGDAARHC